MKPSSQTPLRIGTRGSPLALAQAHETRARLMEAHGLPEAAFEVVVIKTSGDRIQDRPLREVGGKGLFTKEIEEALLDSTIDIAVHSMKDMPVDQPEGLVLECFLPREDPRDGFLSPTAAGIADLKSGDTVGTSSLRRKAQILYKRPDLKVVEFRGNVQTRLRKLDDGVATCTFLAMAGLNRLGLEDIDVSPINSEDMLPAVAQGVIGIEQREGDTPVSELLAPLNDAAASLRVTAERAFLRKLDGSCQMPIAALAELDGGTLHLRGEILRPDGSECLHDNISGTAKDGDALGTALAARLLERAGPNFFD